MWLIFLLIVVSPVFYVMYDSQSKLEKLEIDNKRERLDMEINNDLFKVGVYFGRMLPPHRGHLNAILQAATKCETLYVVVSDNKNTTERQCKEAGIETIKAELRIQWLSQEFLDMPHIKVVLLDETNIPVYPHGWKSWTDLMKQSVGVEIDAFFCGEPEYKPNLEKYFPNAKVMLFDPDRTKYPICATEIRNNPLKHWDYILGPARVFFAKSVLIAGSESCGKSTLTKALAKMYHTSWSEEVGRYYAQQYLGGNETIFTDEDFGRIAHLQFEQDYHALRSANKICFFDTDATITQYYSELYMGHANDDVERFVNPNKYDLVLMLKPDVKWVNDGQRLNGDQKKREKLHEKLKQMYLDRGFNVIEIGGNYNERLNQALDLIQDLLGLNHGGIL